MAGGQTGISGEEPIDRIVLFHFARLNIQVNNQPREGDFAGKESIRQSRIGSDDLDLLPAGKFKHFSQRQRRIGDGRRVLMPPQRIADG